MKIGHMILAGILAGILVADAPALAAADADGCVLEPGGGKCTYNRDRDGDPIQWMRRVVRKLVPEGPKRDQVVKWLEEDVIPDYRLPPEEWRKKHGLLEERQNRKQGGTVYSEGAANSQGGTTNSGQGGGANSESERITAEKLYAGIDDTPFTGRSVAHGTGENANDIAVTITGVNNGDAVNLSATESALPDHPHGGWKGMQYGAAPDGGGAYEAHIYFSPAEGDKFGRHGAGSGYEYGLDANGWLSESHTEGTASRVASLSFDQAAGVKSFELGTGSQVSISGTYHGVSGEYRCTPGTGNNCAARKVAEGFNLGGVTGTNAFDAGNAVWTFKPTDPEARVMNAPDTDYLSYGWWLHKAANDGAFTASAFVLEKGTVEAASGLDTLQGTATYSGGAAGQYALAGTVNDAGSFTARATLNADFSDNSVTGTIDHFRGADGGSRDWSVELKEAALSASGEITRTAAGQENNDTVWTIGATAGDASGEWSGSLQDNGADGVPKVGTGTFHTKFGNDGQMVGAFGVSKQ